MTEAGQARSLNERDYPRNLANADSKAVTPISPAAQKFHLFILCSALDNSVTVSNSFAPGLMLGKRHIADVNQNIAEPHAAIITAIWMNDLIITPNGSRWIAIILLIRTIAWSCAPLALLGTSPVFALSGHARRAGRCPLSRRSGHRPAIPLSRI